MDETRPRNHGTDVAGFEKDLHAFDERAASELSQSTIEALKANGPQFSESELDTIAKRVTAELMKNLSPKVEESRKDEMLRVVGDLIIAVAGAGIWELLLHAMTTVLLLDGPQGRERSKEAQEDAKRRRMAKDELERGLEGEAAEDFADAAITIDDLSRSFSKSFTKNVAALPLVVEVAGQAEKPYTPEGLAKVWSWTITDAIIVALQKESIDRLVERAHHR
jgi:hypothetical protein